MYSKKEPVNTPAPAAPCGFPGQRRRVPRLGSRPAAEGARASAPAAPQPWDVLCAWCVVTRALHGSNGQRHRRCVPSAEVVSLDVLRRHRRASARRSQARRGRRSPAARRGPGRRLPCLPAESGRAGALCAAPSPDAWSARPAPRASPRAHLLWAFTSRLVVGTSVFLA